MEQKPYKFPDEDQEDELQIEIEDDTPPSDRGKIPSDQEFIDDLERDEELDEYSIEAKKKIAGFRKVYHDERREKEAAQREHREAVALAQRLLQENQRVNQVLGNGEKEYINNVQSLAQKELNEAKRAYKDAYEVGDADGVVEAQELMQLATIKLAQAQNMRTGALQTPDYEYLRKLFFDNANKLNITPEYQWS